jgi:hypothetical protein
MSGKSVAPARIPWVRHSCRPSRIQRKPRTERSILGSDDVVLA